MVLMTLLAEDEEKGPNKQSLLIIFSAFSGVLTGIGDEPLPHRSPSAAPNRLGRR
jgi:hypothetical protein